MATLRLARECLNVLGLTSDGFEIETELIVHATMAGLRIAEVPSCELCRISGASNLHRPATAGEYCAPSAASGHSGRHPAPVPDQSRCAVSRTGRLS